MLAIYALCLVPVLLLLLCIIRYEDDGICKDKSKKMNSAASHTVIRPGQCFPDGVHKSIMPVSCSAGKIKFMRYKDSADCSTTPGPIHTFRHGKGCARVEADDDDENPFFVEKFICIQDE